MKPVINLTSQEEPYNLRYVIDLVDLYDGILTARGNLPVLSCEVEDCIYCAVLGTYECPRV